MNSIYKKNFELNIFIEETPKKIQKYIYNDDNKYEL